MNQLAAMAAGVAAIVLLTPEGRKFLGQSPSEGALAAMAALPTTIDGVDVTARDAKDGQAGWFHKGSPIDTYVIERRAFVASRGALSTGNPITDLANLGPYPASMTVAELRELVDAWLAAYKAGAAASSAASRDFALGAFGGFAGTGSELGADVSQAFYDAAAAGTAPQIAGALGVAYGDDPGNWPLTPLGVAVCAVLVHRRRYLAPGAGSLVGDDDVNTGLIRTTFDALWSLAGELEGIAFTLFGARPSQFFDTTHDYSGAAAAAAKASAKAVADAASWGAGKVGDFAGDVLGDAVGAAVRSPWFWVLAIAGVVIWKAVPL